MYTCTCSTVQPSSKRPPAESEAISKDNEQGDPPEASHSVAQNIDGVEDEGLGSETKLDRPASAKGSRKKEAHSEAAPQINGIYNLNFKITNLNDTF